MPLYDYSPAELTPRILSKEEMENPYRVILDLFSYGHLPELRVYYKQWQQCTICGSFHELSVKERSDLFRFFTEMEKLLETAWAIHRLRHPECMHEMANRQSEMYS